MPANADIKLFELLKRKVAATTRERHPGNDIEIKRWKGKEIKSFQDDLMDRVQGRISEKWFYTHLKSEEPTLPRIDILNLLSAYVGYEDWIDFKRKHIKSVSRPGYIPYVSGFFIVVILVGWIFFDGDYNYNFQIIDAITLETISSSEVSVTWLKDNESPEIIGSTENDWWEINSGKRIVRFVIKAPYYQTDTIYRKLKGHQNQEVIHLQPDDYAMMINLYSKSQVENWEYRKAQLNRIFSDECLIFQVDDQGNGMHIYNKSEFVDKLSFPFTDLKNLEILETRTHDNEIFFLRFKIQKNE